MKTFPTRKSANPSGAKEGMPHIHIPHIPVRKSDEERKD
jgi:hypothetical protein